MSCAPWPSSGELDAIECTPLTGHSLEDRMTPTLPAITVLACLLAADTAHAQIKIAVIQELSGTGATAGTNFKNGVELAINEINAAGGILGQKLEAPIDDTQSTPGVAKALALKAVDDGAFAVFGPTFSGSMLVS